MSRKAPKQRLDHLLIQLGLANSPAQALGLIMTGQVLVEDRPMFKPGEAVPESAAIRLKNSTKSRQWASRGGDKLVAGLDLFQIDPQGMVGLDIGASTGGFTDLLLQRGAAKIYAVDVGHGQLAWRLVQDARVINLERTNARELSPQLIPEPIDILVSDVSFISLSKALPAPLSLLKPGGLGVVLVKPQFEAPRAAVATGGVVLDLAVQQQCVARIAHWLTAQGCRVVGHTPSPIKGPKGNQEYLLHFSKPA
ncbi:hemolysin A [Magnetococcus marinus MC-1]|uniref:Hemolysin A n=1 Tax=Magnetococcus marinus (strain ATCC BAA-1437 / JCM 17883 / MC-1) TaxID=156889 RepID=A0L6H2_MAGMM|nr:TlyA family RNA methyltransferase [Magnetococcus marinus]ABK43565.1 hemolysin A [Magnetococcus marinus MC-1]